MYPFYVWIQHDTVVSNWLGCTYLKLFDREGNEDASQGLNYRV